MIRLIILSTAILTYAISSDVTGECVSPFRIVSVFSCQKMQPLFSVDFSLTVLIHKSHNIGY